MKTLPLIFASQCPTFHDLDLHGTSISQDWGGDKIPHETKYLFWVDATHFHFLASEKNPHALSHPQGHSGRYQAELWKYDVAEFFLGSPDSPLYLEFNLAPNGAWWSSVFIAPRKAAPNEPSPIPGVSTRAQFTPIGWQAMASFPLSWLQKHLHFSALSTLNATFILNSPAQIFLTAADLGPGEPDFHRPDQFSKITPVSLA